MSEESINIFYIMLFTYLWKETQNDKGIALISSEIIILVGIELNIIIVASTCGLEKMA